jgi:hypothetical protein
MNTRPVGERFWEKVVRDPDSECWFWTGGTAFGYGNFWLNRKGRMAHRVSYELNVGPIPEGLQIDHLCRTPLCVNPAHLEPVTIRENLMRGWGVSARNAAKTHCPRGHEYAVHGRVKIEGSRECRVCKADLQRQRRAAA